MSKIILITGLNSFVAPHIALHFFDKGWKVRGTVRSPAKVISTLALPVFQPWSEMLEMVVVEDLVNADWSKHLRGVHAVRSAC